MENNFKCKICGCFLTGIIILPVLPSFSVCEKCYLERVKEHHIIHRLNPFIELAGSGIYITNTSSSPSTISFAIYDDFFNKN